MRTPSGAELISQGGPDDGFACGSRARTLVASLSRAEEVSGSANTLEICSRGGLFRAQRLRPYGQPKRRCAGDNSRQLLRSGPT